jgi:DNA-binding transcriptional ArsR family regulator
MRHQLSDIRHVADTDEYANRHKHARKEDFVLDKNIFNNIFEKDIRRVFIYKKAERLAKALHLITPAFAESASLRNRIDAIAIGLVDAAIVPLGTARVALSRELLALSSVLAIGRTSGLLSTMNAELITHEAHTLLQEVAAYEEPRLAFDEVPTLSGIAKDALKSESRSVAIALPRAHARPAPRSRDTKGHIKDTARESKGQLKDRGEAVLAVIRNKERASIKDISTLVRGVSEKTIQRELAALIDAGLVVKQGERRWSVYSLA